MEKKLADYYDTDELAFDPIFVTNYHHLSIKDFLCSYCQKKVFKATKLLHQIFKQIFGMVILILTPFVEWSTLLNVTLIFQFFLLVQINYLLNSQNTFLSRDVIKNYFLFPHVGRMMTYGFYYVESLNYKVVYSKPTVYQDRNIHDLVKDMKNEYLGYENNQNLLKDLYISSEKINTYLPERSNKHLICTRNFDK